MKFADIYEAVHTATTDGAECPTGEYFMTGDDALRWTAVKFGSHRTSKPCSVFCVEHEGVFYRLKSKNPVTCHGTPAHVKAVASQAIKKLSAEEIAALKQTGIV